MAFRGLPIWLLALLAGSLILIASSAITIGVMYKAAAGEAQIQFDAVVSNLHGGISVAVDDLIATLVRTATTIAMVESEIRDCNLPISSGVYSPDLLIGMLTASKVDASGEMQDVGIITLPPNTSVDAGNKMSWEVAQGFGCPEYMYAYTDATLNFVGYCAWQNGTVAITSPPAYEGQDYGLTPEERSLMRGDQKAAFLPIFNLLGKYSLTYEQAVLCPGSSKPYVLTFAQKNLQQLDAFMSTLKVGLTGVAYIVEAKTGFIVTSSVPDDDQARNGTSRVNATESANILIRYSAQFLSKELGFSQYTQPRQFNPETNTKKLLINIRPYEVDFTPAKLGWLVVIVAPSRDYYAVVNRHVGWGILAAVLVTVVAVLMLALFLHLIVANPLRNMQSPGFDKKQYIALEVNNIQDRLN